MESGRHILTAEMLDAGTEGVRTSITCASIGWRATAVASCRSRPDARQRLRPRRVRTPNQPRCPFCPERIDSLTPKLPAAIHPDGRITRGEAVLFPNLHAYASHSCVSVYSPRLHFLPLEEMTERLLADNLLTQVAYAKAVIAADPEARWASINANHMLPAGSSLFHPHLQGIVDSQPTTLQRSPQRYR